MLQRIKGKPSGALCRRVSKLIGSKTMRHFVQHDGGDECEDAADYVCEIEAHCESLHQAFKAALAQCLISGDGNAVAEIQATEPIDHRDANAVIGMGL